MNNSYIALGSNLGDPLWQLQSAVQAISALQQSQLQAVSSPWRSAAVGPGEQPDYLNAVLHLETALPPHELLDALQGIERQQGRERSVRWGARTLDLDILIYDTLQIEDEHLVIPHPRMSERNFVLYPLLEIAGGKLQLPGGAELDTLVATCPQGELTRTTMQLTPDPARRPSDGVNRP